MPFAHANGTDWLAQLIIQKPAQRAKDFQRFGVRLLTTPALWLRHADER